MSTTRDELLAEIAEEEARLTALDHRRDGARARLEMLRQQLASAVHRAFAARLPLTESTAVPTTPTEKVRLFRSLFRGREDVFRSAS